MGYEAQRRLVSLYATVPGSPLRLHREFPPDWRHCANDARSYRCDYPALLLLARCRCEHVTFPGELAAIRNQTRLVRVAQGITEVRVSACTPLIQHVLRLSAHLPPCRYGYEFSSVFGLGYDRLRVTVGK